MGMYGERLGRGVTREAARKYETSVTERARRERWQASGCARVVSRKYGTVVVPHGSNFAALLNAAEPTVRPPACMPCPLSRTGKGSL